MTKENKNLNSYLLFAVSSLLVALSAWSILTSLGKTTVFLLSLLLVILNVWFGERKTGLLTLFTSLLVVVYLFFVTNQFTLGSVTVFSELGLFVIVGTLISFVIEKYKKTDIVNEFEQKEKEYLKAIKKFEDDISRMHKEIKLRDEFLSIASHELKTPLTSMLLKLQSVLHNIRNVSLANFSVENLLKMLETAEQQTQRLSRMINDLLNVSLITTGKLNLELAEADLTEIVKEVTSEFSEKLEKSGYELRLDTDGPLIARVDKLRIEQVLTNLLSNAIKYGNGKPIGVKVARSNSHAKIIVKDHGIGIEHDKNGKIFELFERVVPNNGYKGLGVGLYIVNQIIKAHHGTIKVDSTPTIGSTFTIELPLKQSA